MISCCPQQKDHHLCDYDIAIYQVFHSPNDFILVQQHTSYSICESVDQNSLLLNTLKRCYVLVRLKEDYSNSLKFDSYHSLKQLPLKC